MARLTWVCVLILHVNIVLLCEAGRSSESREDEDGDTNAGFHDEQFYDSQYTCIVHSCTNFKIFYL